jgi:hypothetical protein
MTADQYVESILARYAVPRGPESAAECLGSTVVGPLSRWAGHQLNDLGYSGSYAKRTGVRGISDVDVFVSLKADTRGTLKEIYDSLYQLAQQEGWSPQAQNVSVGVTINGTRGDLVPGRVQPGYQDYQSLYLRKRDTWTQTNVALHVRTVQKSGCVPEIRAVKIWRFLRDIEWPSLYLELFTIEALAGSRISSLAQRVLHVLRTIGADLTSARIEDPANTNNLLSDDLSNWEKQQIAGAATQSAREQHWERIIW